MMVKTSCMYLTSTANQKNMHNKKHSSYYTLSVLSTLIAFLYNYTPITLSSPVLLLLFCQPLIFCSQSECGNRDQPQLITVAPASITFISHSASRMCSSDSLAIPQHTSIYYPTTSHLPFTSRWPETDCRMTRCTLRRLFVFTFFFFFVVLSKHHRLVCFPSGSIIWYVIYWIENEMDVLGKEWWNETRNCHNTINPWKIHIWLPNATNIFTL